FALPTSPPTGGTSHPRTTPHTPPGRRRHRGHNHLHPAEQRQGGRRNRRRRPPRPDDPHPHHHHRQPGPALRATPHRPPRSRQPLHPRPRLQAPRLARNPR